MTWNTDQNLLKEAFLIDILMGEIYTNTFRSGLIYNRHLRLREAWCGGLRSRLEGRNHETTECFGEGIRTTVSSVARLCRLLPARTCSLARARTGRKNQCAYICPRAAIRPLVLTDAEEKNDDEEEW